VTANDRQVFLEAFQSFTEFAAHPASHRSAISLKANFSRGIFYRVTIWLARPVRALSSTLSKAVRHSVLARWPGTLLF
jgi:hypothetical protein